MTGTRAQTGRRRPCGSFNVAAPRPSGGGKAQARSLAQQCAWWGGRGSRSGVSTPSKAAGQKLTNRLPPTNENTNLYGTASQSCPACRCPCRDCGAASLARAGARLGSPTKLVASRPLRRKTRCSCHDEVASAHHCDSVLLGIVLGRFWRRVPSRGRPRHLQGLCVSQQRFGKVTLRNESAARRRPPAPCPAGERGDDVNVSHLPEPRRGAAIPARRLLVGLWIS